MNRKKKNKIFDAKIESNVNQYKVDRLNAEIPAFSSGDLNKYEFSPLGKTFSTGLDKTIPNYQKEGVIKSLKDIKNSLSNIINIQPKDTKLSFDDINKIKENQELNEIKKRIGKMFYMFDDLLRHGIYVEKMLLKFKHDIVKNLNNKLKDNNLSFTESKKINDDIIKKENEIFESKQLIYDYEKVLEKIIGTDYNV